jgi:hypothetical protein
MARARKACTPEFNRQAAAVVTDQKHSVAEVAATRGRRRPPPRTEEGRPQEERRGLPWVGHLTCQEGSASSGPRPGGSKRSAAP